MLPRETTDAFRTICLRWVAVLGELWHFSLEKKRK